MAVSGPFHRGIMHYLRQTNQGIYRLKSRFCSSDAENRRTASPGGAVDASHPATKGTADATQELTAKNGRDAKFPVNGRPDMGNPGSTKRPMLWADPFCFCPFSGDLKPGRWSALVGALVRPCVRTGRQTHRLDLRVEGNGDGGD
jgi:hypothetical protein